MKLLNHFAGNDALNDALSHLHICGAVYCRSEMKGPWAFSVDKRPTATFHFVSKGKGWLEIEGQDSKIAVASGDLLVLPHGQAHLMRDSPRTQPASLDEIIAQHPLEDGMRLRMGSRGPATVLLCGGFQLEGRSTHPLLANLPEVIHIRGRNGRPAPWVQSTLSQIERETRQSHPGAQTLIARLSDILFIQLVRAYFNSQVQADGNKGWVGALKDPQIGMAITHIHRQPDNAWTVASLASQVGMSRSGFSARFTQLVGEPPLKYVSRWRVHKASWYLRTSSAKISVIASRVGFQSEVGLDRVFRKFTGTTPGSFRRAALAAITGNSAVAN